MNRALRRSLVCLIAGAILGPHFVCGLSAATISGTVFTDNNNDGMPSSGEAATDVLLELYVDDGDNTFDGGDGAAVDTASSSASGTYAFHGLETSAVYFVRQPAQTANTLELLEHISPAQRPTRPTELLDDFIESQTVLVSGIDPLSSNSVMQDGGTIVGGERDIYMQLNSGTADARIRVNGFGLSDSLSFDDSAGVTATGIITWDGVDSNPGALPAMGLGGIDLTSGGQNEGLVLQMGADLVGLAEAFMVKIYRNDEHTYSQATIDFPITGGSDSGIAFAHFDSFVGPVDPTSVDAIQLIIDSAEPSLDVQFSFLAAGTPTLYNVANAAVPEPSSRMLAIGAILALLVGARRRDNR